MDEHVQDEVDDSDIRIPLTMVETVNRIFANADQTSSLGKDLSRYLEVSEDIFERDFESEHEAIECLAEFSLTQVVALRQMCCQLATAVDALTSGSTQSRKTTGRSTDGPYRPRN